MNKIINFTITHRFSDVQISDKEFHNLLTILSWQRKPQFPLHGRTAWHILEKAAYPVLMPELKLRAAKIKGIGLRSPEKLIQPTTKVFDEFATYPHFGISHEGEFTQAFSEITPYAGILHRRAIMEFESAKKLFKKGIPTIVPLAVIRYEDQYQFRGEPMGAVVSLSSDISYHRLSELQYGTAFCSYSDPDAKAYCYQFHKALKIREEPSSEEARLRIINILARQLGQLIHHFTEVGIYRYSSEWSNFSYDFERQKILLTDLDSSMPMDNLKQELRILHAMRDLCSLLYRTLSKFYTPQVVDSYTLSNLLSFNPILELLHGYFPKESLPQLEFVAKKLWGYFVPHFFLLKKYKHAIWNEWTVEQRKSYKMDHDLFYILVLTTLYPLFQKSDIFQLYPSGLTEENLLEKAKIYLGERYEYLLYLLDDL